MYKHLIVLIISLTVFGCASIHIADQVEKVPLDIQINSIGGGKLYLPCQLSGISLNCLLDTGATGGQVAINDSSRFKLIGQMGIRGATGTVKICQEVEASNVQLGSIQRANLKLIHCDQDSVNVLGVDILQSQTMLFNFQKNLFSTIPLNQSFKNNKLVKSTAGHFLLPIKLGDRTVLAVWDTGAGTSVIDEQLLKENPRYFQKSFDVTAIDVTGTKSQLTVYQVSGVRIGEVNLPKANFLVRDFKKTKGNVHQDVAIIIGMNVIMHYNWIFDSIVGAWQILEFQ